MKMILKLLLISDIWLGIFKFEKCNTLKKKISEELMPIVLDTNRW